MFEPRDQVNYLGLLGPRTHVAKMSKGVLCPQINCLRRLYRPHETCQSHLEDGWKGTKLVGHLRNSPCCQHGALPLLISQKVICGLPASLDIGDPALRGVLMCLLVSVVTGDIYRPREQNIFRLQKQERKGGARGPGTLSLSGPCLLS